MSAFAKELLGFIEAGVFGEPCIPPKGKTVIPLMLFCTVKENGDIKVRIVANGKRQRPGEDLDPQKLYAPVIIGVMCRITNQVLLAIGAALRAHIHSFDVKTAFLNGYIEEKVYVRMPPGITHNGPPNSCFQLRRSLYGIRQAPAIWYRELASSLRDMAMTQCRSDPCLFWHRRNSDLFLVVLHVDYGLCVSTSLALLEEFKMKLKKRFQIEDLGPVSGKSYLGSTITVDRERKIVHVSCDRKVESLLQEHGL